MAKAHLIIAAKNAVPSWGTEMISHWRSKSRPDRLLTLLLIFGLIFLVAGSALSAELEHKYDGVYSGKRLLTKGAESETCPAEDDVSVTITGETMTFTNSALKNYLMPFNPGPDGSFGETHTDVGGSVVSYHGRIIGDIMDADVKNPSDGCEYHWRLKK